MDNEWDEYAVDWDDDPGARAYAAAAFGAFERLMGSVGRPIAGAHVLDFGCGTGLLTELLVAEGADVHAVDTSPAMLDVLRSKAQLFDTGRVVTEATLPPPEPAFGAVVCSSVCGFVDDYPGTVGALVDRLEPGGVFVQWDWEAVPDDDHGLTRDEIVAALRRAGLADVEVTVGFRVEIDGTVMSPLMGSGHRARSGV